LGKQDDLQHQQNLPQLPKICEQLFRMSLPANMWINK